MRPSLDFPLDQPGLLQHFHVCGDAIERAIEQLGHLQDGEACVCSVRKHVPADGMGQRVKGLVQWRHRIFNHQVEYTRS